MSQVPEGSEHYSRFTDFYPELELVEYRKAGWADAESETWVQAGFNVSSAESWYWYGFEAETAVRLVQNGFDDPEDARGLVDVFDLETILIWAESDVDIEERMDRVDRYIAQGLTREQAGKWVCADEDLWWNPDARPWLSYFEVGECKGWVDEGITDPHEPLQWKRAGAGPKAASSYRRAGVQPGHAAGWIAADVSPDLALLWIRAGVEFPGQKWGGWRHENRTQAPPRFTAVCIEAGMTPAEASDLDTHDPATWDALEVLIGLRRAGQ